MLDTVDFFCGGGGMTYGLRQAGLNVLAGIDIDRSCKNTYIENNPLSKFLEFDVANTEPRELQNHIKIRKGQRNLVFVGCTPCQFWTLLHTNKSKSKNSKNLLTSFGNFVKYFRPGYLLLENVPGIATKRDSPLEPFLELLNSLKYHYEFRVINAADYGIPQTRKRFILMASRLRSVHFPEPTHQNHVTVADIIGQKNGFSKIDAGHTDCSHKMHTTRKLSGKNIERLKMTPPDGGNRLSWSSNEELQIQAYKNKDSYFTDVYGRLYWDKPSPTITTKFMSISNGRFAHPEENRGLSFREGACLQTFPHEFKFVTASLTDAARIVGNAVPPKLAKIFGEAIINNA
jgi:DNA (cytosine-5)-methyltransferase 1